VKAPITRERAERIARGHACLVCGEYSFKKMAVKPVEDRDRSPLGEVWLARRTCGICNAEQELGIDPDGDIVYES
jgi:hypothetical protein